MKGIIYMSPPLPPEKIVTRRYVTLPNGRRCGLGVYVKAWKALLTLSLDARIEGWDHGPVSVRSVLHDLRRGMHERINNHVPEYGCGRKWQIDWYYDALNCARSVNTQRRIVRWVPKEFRTRLAHRLETERP